MKIKSFVSLASMIFKRSSFWMHLVFLAVLFFGAVGDSFAVDYRGLKVEVVVEIDIEGCVSLQ